MKSAALGIATRIQRILAEGDVRLREPVLDVCIGLRYTAVVLSGGTGVAYGIHDGEVRGCGVFGGVRPLKGKPASTVLSFLDSADAVEAAVGLAAVNAMTNRDSEDLIDGDILEVVGLDPGDDVAMVGHFGPLVAPLRARVRSLRIVERVEEAQGGLLPMEKGPEVLGSSQVALITSSSLVNHTLDPLLSAAEHCREVVLLGASTPLVPGAFVGTPVTCLSGVIVVGQAEVLRVVSEAGGMRQFSPFVRKVNLLVER